MKDPKFLDLPSQALGTNFDIEMNNIFRNLIDEEKFFEHTKTIKICVEDILEKKENGKSQIYKIKDVIINISMGL